MVRRPRTSAERRDAAQARRARRAGVTDPDIVMEAAAAFLAVRSRSVAETRQRLVHLGYSAALCDEVVDRLVQLHYLDDEVFAKAWVESRDRARPRGTVALRRELQLKGVPDEVIRTILDARDQAALDHAGPDDDGALTDADRDAARRLLERRSASLRREPDTRRRRQRAYALLARNGFTPDVCHDVATSFIGHDPDDGAGSV